MGRRRSGRPGRAGDRRPLGLPDRRADRPAVELLATSVFEIICAEGFTGSSPSVVRHVRARRGPRFRLAPQVSVRSRPPPAKNPSSTSRTARPGATAFGSADTLWCFGAVPVWSRYLFWWFTTSVDRQHTFEGLVRRFEEPAACRRSRTDRMGAIGTSQGRRFILHPRRVDFAVHHGTEIKACQARDAKRKGKIERPFRGLEASFLEELAVLGPPATITELNAVAGVAGRPGERPGAFGDRLRPAERLAPSAGSLRPCPPRYDTAYAEPRRVHLAVPLVHWKGVRYSVTPACIGQKVAVREEVDSGELTITWAGQDVGRHPVAPPRRRVGSVPPGGRRGGRSRAHPAGPAPGDRRAPPVPRPADPYAGYDVAIPDLADRYGALS